MPEYKIVRVAGEPDYANIPVFTIDHFYGAWQGASGYAPLTQGHFFLREGLGFELSMWCFEERPRALYHNPNDPVHTDSCMEGFVNYDPAQPELGYLSVEMNANAASHSSFGTGRHTRGFVVDRGLPHPEVTVEMIEIQGRPAWRARTLVRLPLLKALYGHCDFPAGHRMKANFYKCGDHADQPHWGSWSFVGRRDFHSPDYFGDLVVE